MQLASRSVLVFLFMFSILIRASDAQVGVAIHGLVSDTSGAMIAGATVDTVVAGRVFASATTGADGAYRLEVPAGVPLELRVHRQGFADHVMAVTGASQPLTRNVTLQVGGVSDTLVVTASRGAEGRTNLTESVTSFTRTDIQALGSTSLADVMRFVPGVNVESNGREGALTSVFSRGGESDYNLVLIDGVRVNQSGGGFDFGRINAAEIERVEVVRGAQSALWGSDAMGSVVQIFTRRAEVGDRIQATASAESGSFGTFRGDARVHGGAARSVDYSAGVSRRSSLGAFADLLPEDDRFEQTAFDGTVGATRGPRLAARGGVRYTDGSGKSVGAIVYGARDRGGRYDTKDLSGHLDVSHSFGSRYSATASFNTFRYQGLSADTIGDPTFATYAVLSGTPNAIFPNGSRLVRLIEVSEFNTLVAAGATPGPGQFLASRQSSDFPFNSPSKFGRSAFRYQGDLAWAGHRLSAGYEGERETNLLADRMALTNQAAFIQQHFTIRDRWFATIGGRLDSKESYDIFFSPKLSAGGYLVPFRRGVVSSLKLFGNLGQGIKSPSLSERFGGPFADPAPELEVERARTGDVGVEGTFADQRFRALVTYFNNDYTDQIAYRGGVAGDGVSEYINIDGSKADGWEAEWALQRPVAGMTAAASYAFVDHRVVTNISTSQQFQPGQPLLRRPKHSGAFRASWVHGRASLSFNARLVGQRHDNSFLSLRTVPNAARPAAITTDITVNPGYAVMGLGFDLRLHPSAALFVRADNLADEVYENALGYPAMPRAFVAGARLQFGARR